MNVLWLIRLSCLRFGAGASDIDHGQQAEHQGLHEAGEEIEIQRKNSGDTKSKDGNTGKDVQSLQDTKNAEYRHDDTENQKNGFFLLRPNNSKESAQRQQNNGNGDAAGGDGVEQYRRS